jgi:adenylate cyclase
MSEGITPVRGGGHTGRLGFRRRPVSIRQSLARNLTWLVLATSGAIAIVSYVTGRRVVAELSGALIEQRIDQVELALQQYFRPIETAMLLMRDWGEAGLLEQIDYEAIDRARVTGEVADMSSIARLSQRSVPLVEHLGRISSMMIADTGGRQFLIGREPQPWTARISHVERWGRDNLFVRRTEDGTLSASTWKPLDFDPRTRPWFTGGLDSEPAGSIHWTAPYKFFTTGEPGITASLRWRDPRDPENPRVIAFDVLLSDISRFTTELPVSPHGKVLIVTEDERVAGLPRDDRFTTAAEIRAHVLQPIRELGLPELDDGIRAWTALGRVPGSVFPFESGGERWWAGGRVFPLGERRFRIAVLAPQRDFLAGVIEQRNIAIAILLAALAVSFGIAANLARRYSRPLAALAAQAERIKQLDVDLADPIVSHVHELDQLASTQEHMRTALDSFSRYVPVDVVRELMRRNEAASIGGERRNITVLFTDIQGFTTIAEALDPEPLTQHMAGYFDAMLGTVQGDGFGEVTQLTGDGFVAFWGAPVECSDHAARAVESVLRCRERLAELNQEWRERGLPMLPTRFGLATGPLIVGNVGSPVRMVYTAVGDTINLASRLEGLNRFYGTWVMVSEDLRNAAGDAFAWRRLDRVRAKGKHLPIDLYELLGRNGEVDAARLAFATRYEDALALYVRREFANSEAALAALLSEYPDDLSVLRLLELARAFQVEPPPEEWDGTTTYQEK